MLFSQYALQAPGDVLPGIVQVITNNSIFIPMLRFKEVMEFSYTYPRQTTLGGIAFRGLNQTYTADTGVINPQTETLRIFGGLIDTDRQLAKGAKGKQIRANNVAAKIKKAALFFDKYVIDGNSTDDPKQFDGLNVRLTGNQVIEAGANGAVLTLKMLDQLLDAVVGGNSGKVLVMNKACRTKVQQLVQSSAGGAAVADFVNGELGRYNGARIEVLDEDGDESPILAFDETQGNNSLNTSIYCVRPGQLDGENFQGLVRRPDGAEPIEYVDYGERGGVYQELVESVMGLALHHPRCAARLKGVKVA
jgi:hypothetical protein